MLLTAGVENIGIPEIPSAEFVRLLPIPFFESCVI